MERAFDDAWRTWVWQNVGDGCSKDVLFKILLDDGFDYDTIREELRHEPSLPLADIANPYAEEEESEKEEIPAVEGGPQLRGERIAPHVWQIDGVLTRSECRALIEMARPRLVRSTIVDDHADHGGESGSVSEIRTGSSATFQPSDETAPVLRSVGAKLRELVSVLSQVPVENQEPFQILHYAEGQHYDRHHDGFTPGSPYLQSQVERGGQRMASFMVYLNDVPAGGQTAFPEHGVEVEAERGRVLFWDNQVDGALFEGSYHASLPVVEGEKWVLVCWIREGEFSEDVAAERGPEGRVPIEAWLGAEASLDPPAWIVDQTCAQQQRVPYLGAGGSACRGFEKLRIDTELWRELRERYAEIRSRLAVESDAAVGSFLRTVRSDLPPALFYEDPDLNAEVLRRLKPLHESWCGFALEPAACYGFRVYLPGAYLHDHVDRPETHVISATLCIDASVYEPWRLHVRDVDGADRQVELAPGELVLYESARIEHGRPVPLNGRFHVGLFVHYRPAEEWEVWCRSPREWWRRHGPGRSRG